MTDISSSAIKERPVGGLVRGRMFFKDLGVGP